MSKSLVIKVVKFLFKQMYPSLFGMKNNISQILEPNEFCKCVDASSAHILGFNNNSIFLDTNKAIGQMR